MSTQEDSAGRPNINTLVTATPGSQGCSAVDHWGYNNGTVAPHLATRLPPGITHHQMRHLFHHADKSVRRLQPPRALKLKRPRQCSRYEVALAAQVPNELQQLHGC
jgi:hypothetical protein